MSLDVTEATDRAIERVKSLIASDADAEGRYPNDTLFLASDHPQFARLVKESLLKRTPVVVVYPDGRERLIRPLDPSEVRPQTSR